jgi:DNA repair exonuclease SbcCD ATPase subunit
LPAIDDFYERAQRSEIEKYLLAEAEPTTSDLSRLEERFAGIEAKIEILNDELDKKDRQLDDERKKRSQLNTEITKLKLALNTYESEDESQSGRIREYELFLDEIARENQKLKADRDKVDDVNNILVAQKTQLEHELSNSPSINGPKALKKKAYDLCTAYLDQLDRVFLDPDSIDTMLSKFSDYSHLLSILQDINDGKNVGVRSIHGRGNRETLYEATAHIRTGTSGIMNMGRIYYKRRADEDRVEVFLQIKKDKSDQRRFINSIP